MSLRSLLLRVVEAYAFQQKKMDENQDYEVITIHVSGEEIEAAYNYLATITNPLQGEPHVPRVDADNSDGPDAVSDL